MAISDKLTQLNNIKSDIKAAIIAKGGTATNDFTTYATAISNLPSGGGGSDDLKNLIERDITSIDIPAGTTKIGTNAFQNCTGLTSVTIPNSVKTIDTNAFQNCISLTSVTLGNSVRTIDTNAFNNCSKLTSVTIPNSVTTIGSSAFYSCTGLTSITSLNTTPPKILKSTFQSVPSTCPIYVPAESVEAYKAAANWSTRADYIQAIQ